MNDRDVQELLAELSGYWIQAIEDRRGQYLVYVGSPPTFRDDSMTTTATDSLRFRHALKRLCWMLKKLPEAMGETAWLRRRVKELLAENRRICEALEEQSGG